MASIRYIRNVMIEGQKATLEIMLGTRVLADKCYARINKEPEIWFVPVEESRQSIVTQGLSIIREKIKGKEVRLPDGTAFNWEGG
jgi:hypothetical protein